jgi:hypothetical protein
VAGEEAGIKRRAFVDLGVVLAFYTGVAALIALLMYLAAGGGSSWLAIDTGRLRALAEAMVGGFGPYLNLVEQKPPLLPFTAALLGLAPRAGAAGSIAILSAVNVLAALLVYWVGRSLYGNLRGFSAGLLFLIPAVFIQSPSFFPVEFAVLFLVLAFILARNDHPAASGLALGLGLGFTPYAFLAVPPLLYLIHASGTRRLPGSVAFIAAAALVLLAIFGAVSRFSGPGAIRGALGWTTGISLATLTALSLDVPAYPPSGLLAFTANLIASVVVVLPLLLLAAAGILKRGLRTAEERTLSLFVAFFLATLLLRAYLSSWILMLPFLALLACRGSAGASSAGDVRNREEPAPKPAAERSPEPPGGPMVFSPPVTGSIPGPHDLEGDRGLMPFRPEKRDEENPRGETPTRNQGEEEEG